MLRSIKLLTVLALIVSILCALPCTSSAVTWNLKDDLAVGSAENGSITLAQPSGALVNPNGDWSYGWAANANPFTGYIFVPYTGFGTKVGGDSFRYNPQPCVYGNTVWHVWSPSTSNQDIPSIDYNNRSTPPPDSSWIPLNTTQAANAQPYDVVLISGYKSGTPSGRKSIARWTAPGTGTYTVNATFLNRFVLVGGQSNGYDADVHVIKNATTSLQSGVVGSTEVGGPITESVTYSDTLSLNAGDTLDFVVGAGTVPAISRGGVAAVEVTISTTSSFATVTGRVSAASGGASLEGARVEVVGGVRYTTTDASGNYTLKLMTGTHTLKVSKEGYVPKTIQVTVTSGGTYPNNNVQLDNPRVTGTVLAGGQPVNMAKVSVVGGTEYAFTNTDGIYSLALAPGTYNLEVTKNQFSGDSANGVVVSTGATIQNFNITMNAGASWPTYIGIDRTKPNPHSDWTYGWAPDATPFVGYTFTPMPTMFLGKHSGWTYDDTIVVMNGGPDSHLHIWPLDGKGNMTVMVPGTNKKTVARFTAPVAGWYTINGGFGPWGYSEQVDRHIVVNNSAVLLTNTDLGGIPVSIYTAVYLPKGGTVDFAVGDGENGRTRNGVPDATQLSATITFGASGATGWVKDAGGNPIAGAKVQAGADETVTDENGNYTLPTSTTGSVSITVSKPTYETHTQVITINAGVLTTHNVTLAASGIFSGRVLAKPAPGSPIADATLKTLDGAYSVTTGTDGSFSAPVTSGTYEFKVYKSGFLPQTINVTIPSQGLAYGDIMMIKGWDLATDWSSAANPNGVWTYAYEYNSDSTVLTMPLVAARNNWPEEMKTWAYHGHSQSLPSVHTAVWLYNGNDAYKSEIGYFRGHAEPFSILTHPGGAFSGTSGVKTVARFTAPEGGYYDVDIRWTGRTDHDTEYQTDIDGGTGPLPPTPSVDGTTASVAYRKNGVVITSDQLDGFVGTPAAEYTDSFGTKPEITYHEGIALEAGDILEVVVGGNNCGWTGVDFSISATSAAYISGRVTSDRPGNPPVAEATVWAFGGELTLSAKTDANGYYVMPVQPEVEYEIEVERHGHATMEDVVVPQPGENVVRDYTLHFKWEWDAAADFSEKYNPINDWTYGYVSATVPLEQRASTFQPYPNYLSRITYNGFPGWTTTGGFWIGGFGKNTTGAPISAFSGPEEKWWIEDKQFYQIPGGQWGDPPQLSSLRWTAPKDMVIEIDATWKNQYVPGNLVVGGQYYYAMYPLAMKNGMVMTAPKLGGFVGKSTNGYTDSVAPYSTNWSMEESLKTVIPVSVGDVLDFTFEWNNIDMYILGLDVNIKEGSGETVTSIQEIKNLPVGTNVFMTTPVQLATVTVGTGSFGWEYGTGLAEKSFFIQSDDRTQGMKCVIPAGGLPTLSPANKITFSGKIALDYLGQKVVEVGSINSYEASDEPRPLGKVCKSVTNSGTLVKVWGKIVSLTPHPNPVYFDEEHAEYTYLEITINDGSKPIKILTSVSTEWMSNYDPPISLLSVGDYIGVIGIAYTSTEDGSEIVVMPRSRADFTFIQDVQ